MSPGKGGGVHKELPVFNTVKEVCIQSLSTIPSLLSLRLRRAQEQRPQ